MGIKNALNNRPVRVLGFLASVHAMTYGVGYIFNLGGFTGTVLYVNFGNRISTAIFGIVLLLAGSLLAFAYARNNPKTIEHASMFLSLAWIYASMTYILNGAWMLALGISTPWMFLSYYLAFAFARRVDIIAYDQTPKAKYDTRTEDKL